MKAIKPMKARAFIAKLLVLCMIVGLLPTVALAAEPEWTKGNTYVLTEDTTWTEYTIGDDATGKQAPVYTVTADTKNVEFTMEKPKISNNNILEITNGDNAVITLYANNVQLYGAMVIDAGVVIRSLSFFGDRDLMKTSGFALMAVTTYPGNGTVVLNGATVDGEVTVHEGTTLVLKDATVNKPITVEAGATVKVEGKVELNAQVTVQNGATVDYAEKSEIGGKAEVVAEPGAKVTGTAPENAMTEYTVNVTGEGTVTYTVGNDTKPVEGDTVKVPSNSASVVFTAEAGTDYILEDITTDVVGADVNKNEGTVTLTKGTDPLQPGTITVTFKEKPVTPPATLEVVYDVTIEGKGSVTYTVDNDTEKAVTLKESGKVTVPVDSEVEFTVKADDGYELKSATYTVGEDADPVNFVDGKATLTATKDGTIDVVFTKNSGGGGGNTRPTVTVKTASATNGSFTVSNQYAGAGQTVTITVNPDKGYMVDEVTVTDRNGDPVAVVNNGNGTYSFVMPKSSLLPVTVTVTFKTAPEFTDVPADSYYAEAVEWAASLGIVAGKTDTTFEPYAGCTRAEFVTFLWRAAGSPEPTSTENPFTDVDVDDFYGKAVLWAVEKKIVAGITPDTFAPNEVCLRSQAVAFLYRYEGSKKVDDESKFTDVPSDQYYADAVAWGVDSKVVYGITDTTFAPNEMCNRAQVVCFLYRDFVK